MCASVQRKKACQNILPNAALDSGIACEAAFALYLTQVTDVVDRQARRFFQVVLAITIAAVAVISEDEQEVVAVGRSQRPLAINVPVENSLP